MTDTTSADDGERHALTRRRILDAALALVDSEGLKALSMRRLGAALGVEAMSLYHHFPSKEELLDGLVATVLSEVPLPEATPTGWEDAVRYGFASPFRRILLALSDSSRSSPTGHRCSERRWSWWRVPSPSWRPPVRTAPGGSSLDDPALLHVRVRPV